MSGTARKASMMEDSASPSRQGGADLVRPLRRHSSMLGELRRSIAGGGIRAYNQEVDTLGRKSVKRVDRLRVEDAAVYFKQKWGGPLILGPLPIAILAISLIVSGSHITNMKERGSCGYPINSFVSGCIATCYLFLVIYSWAFLGHQVKINGWVILTPFTSLSSLVSWYIVIGIASLVNFAIGALYLYQGSFCAVSTPILFNFAYTISVIYWMVITFVIFNVLKIHYDFSFMRFLVNYENTTEEDVETEFFNKKFAMFVNKSVNTFEIPAASLASLLKELLINATEREVDQWLGMLDPKGAGVIAKDDMYRWYALRLKKDRSERQDES